jgi:membrane protein YdbS with pleckstrin-like domain
LTKGLFYGKIGILQILEGHKMGKYLESNLSRDELVMENAKVHGIVIAAYIFILVFNVVLGLFLFSLNDRSEVFLYITIIPLITVIRAVLGIMRLLFLELGFTNKRVMGKEGVINTKRLDSPLNKIDNVSIEQGLGGKIFGFGTIVISSTSSKLKFPHIKTQEVFRSKLMQQIEIFDENRIKKQAEMMTQSNVRNISASATSNTDDLIKFKKLLDDGVISQEDFEAKKKELLGL